MPRDTNKPPAFMFYVDDFASDGDVEAMSTEAVGAYILLLCKAWREDPPATIPNNDRILARWARVSDSVWEDLRREVLAPWHPVTDDRLVQPRLRREFEKQRANRTKRSTSGRKGAEARWERHSKRIGNANGGANGKRMAKESESVNETATENPTSQEDESRPGGAAWKAQVDAVIERYLSHHPRAKPGRKERAKIRALLKDGFTVDDLCLAIEGCHKSPYHCGENEKGQKYQNLELIVRDSSKVNQFMALAEKHGGPQLSARSRKNLEATRKLWENDE